MWQNRLSNKILVTLATQGLLSPAMETIQYRKSRIREMKEEECTKKPRQESVLCEILYARYMEKCFTQTYKALYEDVMLVSL